MKKLSTLLLSAAIPAFIWGAEPKTVPYTSSLAITGSELDSEWTVIDANADSRTWEPGSEGNKAYAIYSWAANQADDWLISPGITLEAGKEYNMTFLMRTGGFTEAIKAFVAASPTPDALLATTPITYFEGSSTTPITLGGKVTVPATGTYYFGLYACSPVDQYKLYVRDFMIVERVFAPAPVTDLKTERGADKALSVTLSWVLPTTDVLGTPLSADEDITAVKIYRNGAETPLAVLDGDAADYEDTAATGLQPGVHTYDVTVVAAGVESARTSVTTPYIGVPPAAALPCSFDFNKESSMDMWVSFKGPHASVAQSPDGYGVDEWKWSDFAKYAYICMREGQQDHYFVAPPFHVDHAGTYRMTVKLATNTQSEGPEVEFRLGQSAAIDGLTTVVKEGVVPPYQSNVMATYPLTTVDFTVSEPGDYYMGMHMTGTNINPPSHSPYYYYYVYNCSFEEIPVVPAQITDVTTTPGETNTLEMTFSWTAPSVTSSGDPLSADDFTVKITRDGVTVANVPGSETSWTDEVDRNGFYTYTLTAIGHTGLTDGEPVEFVDLWVGDNALDLPYTANFERAPEREMWEIIDANTDGYTWEWNKRYGYHRLVLHQAPAPETSGTSADGESSSDENILVYDNDYILTPLLHFEAGDYMLNYQHMGFIYNGDDQLESSIFYEVGVVADGDFDSEGANLMQQERRNIDIDYIRAAPAYRFNISEPGKYRLAFAAVHAHRPTITNAYLTISDVKVESDPSSLTDMPDHSQDIIVNGTHVTLPDGACDVTLTDISGRVVMALGSETNVDLTALPAGVYILSARTGSTIRAIKLTR